MGLATDELSGPAGFHAIISGRVQMVGFRAFALDRALALGATGYVRNLSSGQVEVVAEGDRRLMEKFLKALREGPRGARVTGVSVTWQVPRGRHADFSVRHGAC